MPLNDMSLYVSNTLICWNSNLVLTNLKKKMKIQRRWSWNLQVFWIVEICFICTLKASCKSFGHMTHIFSIVINTTVTLFLSPDPMNQVSCFITWCPLFVVVGEVIVARRRSLTFIKFWSSEFKQTWPQLILGVFTLNKNESDDCAYKPTWLQWLKMEQRGKMQIFAFISQLNL